MAERQNPGPLIDEMNAGIDHTGLSNLGCNPIRNPIESPTGTKVRRHQDRWA